MKSFPWKIIVVLGAILVAFGFALPKVLRKNVEGPALVKTSYIDTVAHTQLIVAFDRDDLENRYYKRELKAYKQAFKEERVKSARFKQSNDKLAITFAEIGDEKKGVNIIKSLARSFDYVGPHGDTLKKKHIDINARPIRSYTIEIAPEYLDLAYKQAMKDVAINLEGLLPLQKDEIIDVQHVGAGGILVKFANIDDKRIDRLFVALNNSVTSGLSAGTLPAKLRVIERERIMPQG